MNTYKILIGMCICRGYYTYICFLVLSDERAWKYWHPSCHGTYSPINNISLQLKEPGVFGEMANSRVGTRNIHNNCGASCSGRNYGNSQK